MLPPTLRIVPHKPAAPLLRYGSALAGVFLAALARAWLRPLLGDLYPFPTFFVASMVTAWYAGFWPALLSLGLGCLAATYFFVPPTSAWAPQWLGIGLYLFVGLTNAALSESLRRARDAAEQARQAMNDQSELLRAANQESAAVNHQMRSQQSALRREQELLQRIIDTIPVMIATYEPSTHVLRLNPEFERLTGWSTEEARQVDLMEKCYPDPEYREWVREYMQSLQPGWRDLRMSTKDGRVIETSWANIRLSDETQIGIGIDISQRKWLEDELRRRVEALDEADRQKDQFIAVLAHELRNPLAPIQNAVELLKAKVERISYSVSKNHVAPPDTQYGLRNTLSIIDRRVRQQARLLDDLLDVSRVSRSKIRLRRERLDLVSLVRDAAEDCRGLLEQARLTLLLDLPEEPIWVEGDPTRLAQVVGNLLHNSAKFTDAGGTVGVQAFRRSGGIHRDGYPLAGEDEQDGNGPDQHRPGPGPAASQPPPVHPGHPVHPVNARAGPERLNTAVITIRDTGVGIEPELLPHLFDTFTQADRSLERTRGGLGLGLALVKGLVELHGGEVEAASPGIGRGAEFTVRLPTLDPGSRISDSEPSDNPNAQRAREIQDPKSMRLLIIEDNRDAADSLRELLELSGCTVEVAYSGPEGVRLARQRRPEAVLCDLGLPGMSGYEVAAQLRQNPELAGVRLIALSGYGQEEDQRRAREAGFDRQLTKPVEFAELQRLLELPAATARD
jgi:PAS domain S-box-containing protein